MEKERLNMKSIYITTPIYYPNSDPHIGTAYTTIIADFLSRYYKMKNYKVFFLTGNDENSVKVEEAAQKLGLKPKEYVDKMAELFKQIWSKLDIQYDKFIRTTDEYHVKTASYVFNKLYKESYIYKGNYEGWYCKSCETFWPKSKVGQDKLCPNTECQKPLQWIKEDNYFFKLSYFQEKLIKFYEENPDNIFPKTRYNEILSFIKSGLQDISVSRKNLEWGIKVPFDINYTIYVWIDALTNYISALGYPENFMMDYWENIYHIMGKDIIRFHAVIWPSILMALNLPSPKKIIAHGWLTTPSNEKISKSKGGDMFNLKEFVFNNPPYLIMALRYYLLREGSFGDDIPVNLERFIQIYNSELANNLGNLVSRVVTLIQKNLDNKVIKKQEISEVFNLAQETENNFNKLIENFEFSKAIEVILNFSSYLNKMIEEKKPWELKNNKEKLNDILFELSYGILAISKLIYPVMPQISIKILKQMGISKINFELKDIDSLKIKYKEILFPTIKEYSIKLST
ncbi:MAG: methionine--tRNA ligase [bacterium]